MLKRIRQIVMGMMITAGALGVLPAGGCITALDSNYLSDSNSSDLNVGPQEVPNIVLKSVAII